MSLSVERVARAIATVREQNGAAPYDGWAAIHGEKAARRLREALFEEARAAMDAMRVPDFFLAGAIQGILAGYRLENGETAVSRDEATEIMGKIMDAAIKGPL
jgi:hypothetical protein